MYKNVGVNLQSIYSKLHIYCPNLKNISIVYKNNFIYKNELTLKYNGIPINNQLQHITMTQNVTTELSDVLQQFPKLQTCKISLELYKMLLMIGIIITAHMYQIFNKCDILHESLKIIDIKFDLYNLNQLQYSQKIEGTINYLFENCPNIEKLSINCDHYLDLKHKWEPKWCQILTNSNHLNASN